MIALVQVLIAAVLIPFAFAAPDRLDSDVDQDTVARSMTSVELLQITVVMVVSGHLVHVISSRLVHSCQYHLMASVEQGLDSDVGQKIVAREMASVGLLKVIVTLAVSRRLAHVAPSRPTYRS
ncbi:hypothetical protein BASA50_003533 [Batrachochytrium salamandrivorans]|uniref:Solute carrier family 40 protein n=1 Tax=Batrachochytrium salamandrivorans TaxID=1357716 RepID=A0ABQ8FKS3_9FUNG|nr:hypothetical protein BASA50_003533 [Batrachochytrium salamandrivorans]